MKRKFVLAFIGLILGLVGITTLSSCDKGQYPATQDYVDNAVQVAVQQLTEDIEFKSVQEVLDYRAKLLEEEDIDGVFRSIPQQLIGEVAGVLLKRGATCTKKSIVIEYNNHSDVYDNLSNTTPVEDDPPQAIPEPKPDSITPPTPTTKDTVIDGKKAKIVYE